MKYENSTESSTNVQLNMKDLPTFIERYNEYSRSRFKSDFNNSHFNAKRADFKGVWNTEFVQSLMEFSPYGGLAQGVLLQAIQTGLLHMVNNPMGDKMSFTPEDNERYIVSGEAWNGNALHLLIQYAAMYAQEDLPVND